MKPVVIFRHAPSEGAGYLASFLDEQGIPWQMVRIDAGEAVPESVAGFSGLVLMGGPMSVNDDLPWIPPLLARLRQAVALDIPLLGHCLGGQLMARALGGTVGANPVKEIGWGEVTVRDSALARDWFGADCPSFAAFHWHGETFTLPEGAQWLLSSPFCPHQAFALGKHLALQCHVEMTEPMIRDWYALGADEVAASASSPAVQPAAEAYAEMAEKLPALHALARRLYTRWLAGLSRN